MATRQVPRGVSVPAGLPAAPREPLFDLELHVVTPMFGGGAEPAVSDGDWPIRGSTIRGHLRFWWRACNAHLYGTAAELFEKEAEIWGSASRKGDPKSGPSAIDIDVWVNEQDRGTSASASRDDYPGYALFPFRGEDGAPSVDGRVNITFRLRLMPAEQVEEPDKPNLKRHVEAALWAWITFGGIGARTRRGCGSLWCDSPGFHPPDAAGAERWLAERARVHAAGDSRSESVDIPQLRGGTVLLNRQATVIAAWNQSVDVMKQFRQSRSTPVEGEKPTRNWPESAAVLRRYPESAFAW